MLPGLIFFCSLVTVAFLWREQIPRPFLPGQVEAVTAEVSSPKGGLLAELHHREFQLVAKGDPIAQVITTDPQIVQASLSVIQAEIQLLRVSMEPIQAQQRLAMSTDRLRLDWMEQRVELATARTRLQLAESELARTERLCNERIASQQALEEARSSRDRLAVEVEERHKLVSELNPNVQNTQFPGGVSSSTNSMPGQDTLRASLRVQEEKLRLTEAELKPVVLRAPIDGAISAIHRRTGEAINAGEPIVTVAARTSDRIIAYVQPALVTRPVSGTEVEVYARASNRPLCRSTIVHVGAQVQPITQVLRLATPNGSVEFGLPIAVRIPPDVELMPGEIVDLKIALTPMETQERIEAAQLVNRDTADFRKKQYEHDKTIQ